MGKVIQWICVTSVGSARNIYVRTDQIDLVVEVNVEGHFNRNGVWVAPVKGSQIVLRSGEKGECLELPDEIFRLMNK